MNQWFPNKSPTSKRMATLLRLSFISFLVLFPIFLSAPVHSETTVYAWEDANGDITYSDNPGNAPSDARVKVLSKNTYPQTVSEPVSEIGLAQAAPPQLPEPSPRVATQGEFAIQLVEELGLADAPTEDEAADLLTSVRISPRLGQWELEEPMSPELTARLRQLTVAAAEMGWIMLSPEQVLLAFDTASALLGLSLPAATGPEEASESPYPIAEAPSLVYVAPPPPDFYPYYLWTPVAGGFWWGDALFTGFYVLDVNLFFSHHHHFFFRDRIMGLDSGRIGRHFRSHIQDHQVVSASVLSTTKSGGRTGSGVGSKPASRRMTSPPTRSDSGLRPFGSHFSGRQQERRYASAQPTTMPSAIDRPSLPSRSIASTTMIRPSPRSLPARQNSSPAISAVKQSAPSMSRGFNAGMSQGDFESVSSRGSSRK